MNGQHYVDGKWVDGNPTVMRVWDHAIWMEQVAIFDGARCFEGVTPDLELHCQRTLRSAEALGLKSPLSAGEIEDLLREGIAKFAKGTPLYLRPFMYSEEGWMEPFPESTRLIVSVVELRCPTPPSPAASASPNGAALAGNRADQRQGGEPLCPGRARRPGCAVARLQRGDHAGPHGQRGGVQRRQSLDRQGRRRPYAGAERNLLNGITRQRTIQLLRKAGVEVYRAHADAQGHPGSERDLLQRQLRQADADTQVEDRPLQPGPIFRRARELYWEFAHGG